MTDETDNFPTVIGRPVFDTMPCPRPGDFTGKDESGHPVRVSANGRAAFPVSRLGPGEFAVSLSFPGGAVPVPEPTRAALLLSAKQWAVSVREHFVDMFAGELMGYEQTDAVMLGKLDRLDAVLAELAAMEAE